MESSSRVVWHPLLEWLHNNWGNPGQAEPRTRFFVRTGRTNPAPANHSQSDVTVYVTAVIQSGVGNPKQGTQDVAKEGLRPIWRGGRVADCTGLENRQHFGVRGFESL